MKPFPEYPELHLQSKLPFVFVHVAWSLHPPLFVKHSLISIWNIYIKSSKKKKEKRKKKKEKRKKKKENREPEQLKPFPKYPVLHLQSKLPSVFVHAAFVEHSPLFVKHSLISIWEIY